MTDQPQSTTDSPFWRKLFTILQRDDRAALAKLRRAVASPIDGDVFAVLGDAVGDVRDRDLDAHLFIACLFAIHPARGSGAKRERFEDSNRYVRGRVIEALASGTDLPDGIELERLERAISSLIADGLVCRDGNVLSLPT